MNARDELYAALAEGVKHAQLRQHHIDAYRAEVLREVLPQWEAVYEPGNVSDYLIGYTNDELPGKRAAEAWFRSQCDTTNEIEWVAQPVLATGRYDAWHELIQIDSDDGMVLSTGLIVRHLADEAVR